jgi:hypothetical protein
MAIRNAITPSVPKPNADVIRPQSQLDYNVPEKNIRTPRSEWRFMRKYELICGTQQHRGTGPLGGSEVAQ